MKMKSISLQGKCDIGKRNTMQLLNPIVLTTISSVLISISLSEKILSRPDVSQEKNEDASSGVSEAATLSSSPDATSMEMESLTVAELRSRLKEKGKAVSGRKAELIKRLRATGAGGGTPAINEDAFARKSSASSSLVASTNNTVAKENFSPSSRSSSTSLKLGTPKSASSSSATSSSSKDQSSLLGRPPRKRPATSARSAPTRASTNTRASARTGTCSSSNLTKHARQPGAGATADILTASAKKRRRRSMTRAVEQMEVEMANIAEEGK